MGKVERDPWWSPGPSPCSSRAAYSRLPTISMWLLKISREEHPTTSPGSLCQCLYQNMNLFFSRCRTSHFFCLIFFFSKQLHLQQTTKLICTTKTHCPNSNKLILYTFEPRFVEPFDLEYKVICL